MLAFLLLSAHVHAQEPATGLKPPLPGEAPPAGQAGGGPGGAPGMKPAGAPGMGGAPGMVPGGGPGMGGAPGGGPGMGGAPGMVPGGGPGLKPGGAAPGGQAGKDEKANLRQVIVRATAPGAKAVEVTAAAGSDPLVVPLNDEGTMPDLRAGDGEFGGDGLFPADEVSITVKVDGATLSAGSVSWEPTQELRVLELKVADGTATATATVGSRNEKKPGAGETKAPLGAAAPAAPGGKPADGSSGLVFPAAVLVGLVAAGALVGLLPRRGAGGDNVPSGLVPVPTGGILGPNTPTFADGARVWGASAEDRPRLLAALLDALSPGRDVVVAIADGETLPTPPTGGVFRTSAAPKVALAAARGLSRPGRPTVVLVVPPVGEAATGWPARSPGCEILVIAAPLAEGMDVIVQRDGAGLRVRSRQGDARIG